MAQDLRGDDYIDSRDVIERIEELESELQDVHDKEFDEWLEARGEGTSADDEDKEVPTKFDEWLRWVHDGGPSHLYWEEVDEYLDLIELRDQAQGYGDWDHGETLIHESKFKEYAEQLAEDIGAIDRHAAWPLTHIDWEAAAQDLRADYMEVEFNGDTYLMRF